MQAPISLGSEYQLNSVTGNVIWLNGDGPAPIPVDTSVSLAINGNGGSIEFGRADGDAFNLLGFMHAFGGAGEFDFTISAILADGGTVVDVLTVNEVDFQYDTFVDSGLFNNILSFSVSIAGGTPPLAIDNVMVSAVPVPAAVWLFGSALAGLGWMRRKQSV